MRKRSSWVVTVALLLAAGPLVARASCDGLVQNAPAAVQVVNLTSAINAAGLRDFGETQSAGRIGEVAVSPFATWYLNQYVNETWGNLDQMATSRLLRNLSNMLDVSASITAQARVAGFTSQDEDIAARALCASTRWTSKAISDPASVPGSPSYALHVTVSLHGSFDLSAHGDTIRVPFFDNGSVRGIRLDASNVPLSLFLFLGTEDALTDFRRGLPHTEWTSVTSEFGDRSVVVDDISLDRKAFAALPASLSQSFGTIISPVDSVQHALTESLTLSVAGKRVTFSINGALRGYSTTLGTKMIDGKLVRMKVAYFSVSDPGTSVPGGRRFSSVRPLIYAVEDRRSGMILLIGMHD